MSSLTSPKVLREVLERHDFRFSKSLGQNFLIDENTLDKIVGGANINKDDFVLEIGPGAGTMTRILCEKASRVVAVEIDKTLIPVLEETLSDYTNIDIVNGDILKLNLESLINQYFNGRPIKIVANLPYYITTPIIMRFMEEEIPFKTMVIMVQKEVADRINASPGTKDYGALTVALGYYAQSRIVGRVPSTVFIPPPKVDSMVIALDRREEPPVIVKDKKVFFQTIKGVFAQRRKTLLNTLSAARIMDKSREEVKEILEKCNIDPARRGETLDVKEIADIANGFIE